MTAVRWTSCVRLVSSVRILQLSPEVRRAGRFLVSSSHRAPQSNHFKLSASQHSIPTGSCRCFASKSKNDTSTKHGDDSDDSEWDDDVELPFDDVDDNDTHTRENDIPTSKHTNTALQSVIDAGLVQLKATSTLISNKKETKKPLFHKAAIENADLGPTKQQLAEANRVFSAATRCLEELHRRQKRRKSQLQIGGFSIVIVDVEVNANLREATVVWTLPFEILLEANESTRQELTKRMQHQLESGGGGKFLQGEVHRVLSHYYPPKLKFKAASDGEVQQLMDFS